MFDRLADVIEAFTDKLELDSYSLYVMDYGAPVGFRLAVRHPEKVEALIVQNGNAYVEGLREFWNSIKACWADRSAEKGDALRGLLKIDATKWQYMHGPRDPEGLSPDGWNVDRRFLDRHGNQEITLALFYDYGSNPGRYPAWQAYFREYQPPTLIVWGENDHIFPADGAHRAVALTGLQGPNRASRDLRCRRADTRRYRRIPLRCSSKKATSLRKRS